MRDNAFSEAAIQMLINHGMDSTEARIFVIDHGDVRAAIWLRTCEFCRGKSYQERNRCYGKKKS